MHGELVLLSIFHLLCQRDTHFCVSLKPTNELQFFWLTFIYLAINCILRRQSRFYLSIHMIYFPDLIFFSVKEKLHYMIQ
jgi:hypothetical protein